MGFGCSVTQAAGHSLKEKELVHGGSVWLCNFLTVYPYSSDLSHHPASDLRYHPASDL